MMLLLSAAAVLGISSMILVRYLFYKSFTPVDFILPLPFILYLIVSGLLRREPLSLHMFISTLILLVPVGFMFSSLSGAYYLFQIFIPILILLNAEEINPNPYLISYAVAVVVSVVLFLVSGRPGDFNPFLTVCVALMSLLVVMFCHLIQNVFHKICRRLVYLVDIDQKTKLPNRDKFIKEIAGLNDSVALVIVSIDDFKELNDLYGYRIGDDILVSVGTLLQSMTSDWEVYRLSGADFGIVKRVGEILPSVLSTVIISAFQTTFQDSMEMEMEMEPGGFSINIQLSVGISVEGLQNTNRSNLMTNADLALREAKKYRSKIQLYRMDNKLLLKLNDKFYWERKLKESFREDLFFVSYQPILNNRTNCVEKYECLARLRDPDGTVYTPGQFMGYLNSGKNRFKFTRTILEKSFQALNQVTQDISINISIEDLLDPVTRQYIFFMLEKYSHQSYRIQFEILENDYMGERRESVADILAGLKAFRCKIAIDDFGSGYANFDYLTKLKVNYVKLDGSLIQDICGNHSTYTMVRSIVSICRELDIEIVAEFVSDFSIYHKVKELDISFSQGYYIGKPAPLEFYKQFELIS